MKKSINAWAFPDEMSFEEVFATAKKYGFEAIELNVDEEKRGCKHGFHFNTTDATLEEVKGLIAKYGIEVQSVSCSQYWTAGAFASHKEEERDEAIKILRTQLRCAKALGADGILVVTSIDPAIGLMKSMDNTIKVFRDLKDEIDASGVKVGLENVWNNFFSSPLDVKYVLDGIDNKNVGIYFDIGNMLEFSESEWWIDVIGKNIVKVHIKDFKRAGMYHNGGTFCKLLEGDVNFKAAIPMLKAAGYDGTMTAELFPEADTNLDEFYTEISTAMDKIMAM